MQLPRLRFPGFHFRNPFRNPTVAPTPSVVVTPVEPVRPESAASHRSVQLQDASVFEPRPDPVTPIPGRFGTSPAPEWASGSAPPSYRSHSAPNSAAPSYQGTPLREGEQRLHHDGQPIYERYEISGGRMGTPYPRQIRLAHSYPDSADISPLHLSPVQSRPGTPGSEVGGERSRLVSRGSLGSMTSSQLEAHLESLPLLSRLPTPP